MKLTDQIAVCLCAAALFLGTAAAGPQHATAGHQDSSARATDGESNPWAFVGGAWRVMKAMTTADASWMLEELGRLSRLDHRPAVGDLSSPFGYRRDPIRRRRTKFHRGLDFSGKRGDPAMAAGAGMVAVAKRRRGYGRVVYIDHGNGLETRYAHLQRINVREGQTVEAGTVIGAIGSSGRSTGPHLHFEIRLDGKAVDPALAMATVLGPAGAFLSRIWPKQPQRQSRSTLMNNRY